MRADTTSSRRPRWVPGALARVADDVGLTVTVLGTPAEEGGGGKILLLDRGAFDGAHAAMMIHPWPDDRLVPPCLAVDHIDVSYTGRSAHASAAPHQGNQRRRRSHDRSGRHRTPPPALAPGTRSMASSPKAATRRMWFPHTEGRFMMRALALEALRCCDRGSNTASRRARSRRAQRSRSRDLSPAYSHMVTGPGTRRRLAQCRGARARYPAEDAGAPPPMFSTDMANVSSRSDDPSAPGDRNVGSGQPPTRVRCRMRRPLCEQGCARRRHPDGMDRHRRWRPIRCCGPRYSAERRTTPSGAAAVDAELLSQHVGDLSEGRHPAECHSHGIEKVLSPSGCCRESRREPINATLVTRSALTRFVRSICVRASSGSSGNTSVGWDSGST